MLRYVSLIYSFFRVFIMKWYCTLSKAFCIYLYDQVIYILGSIYDMFIGLHILNYFHPRNEANLVMVDDLFNMLMNLAYKHFIKNF